ncbi:MAG: peptidoglycan DD-metalloendopeptidase family protein [Lachnospiraceae bacterium]|nr:peptidoglycan DD-metalloendopeptidase family protein [Lachnospiraceae bacterium]
MSENKNEKLKYTVLLVPNNNHRVKQFQVSFDFIIFSSAVLAVLLISLAIFIARSASFVQDYEDKLLEKDELITEYEKEEIVLQARIEELEDTLHDAKVTIDATKNLKEQVEKEQTEASIPTSMPVGKIASIPEYQADENKQYIQFIVDRGTKILATADGTVRLIADDDVYGYRLKLDFGNGYESEYLLKDKPQVNEGDRVSRGNTLFTVTTDVTTLSYRVYFNGEVINPMDVIKIDG